MGRILVADGFIGRRLLRLLLLRMERALRRDTWRQADREERDESESEEVAHQATFDLGWSSFSSVFLNITPAATW